jgi:hypothetical protein
MRTTHVILFIALLSLALGGCGGSTAVDQSPTVAPLDPHVLPTATTPSNPFDNPLQLNTPESEDMPSNPPPVEKFIALSKTDLAVRLQVEADKIAIVKAEAIDWPDAALGCPSPGKVYAQGQVPGFRIRLAVDGKEYDYHTDFTGQVILCPEPASRDSNNPPSTSGSPTPSIGVPID